MINQIRNIILARRDPIKYARKLGVSVGSRCRFLGVSGRTFGSEPYLIRIGDHVELAAEVAFITHDGGAWVFRDELPDLDVFGTIEIGNNVFIGLRVTILPGTRIGDNCVIGAGSLVKGNIEANSVYAGVPARKLRTMAEYRENLQKASLDTKRMLFKDKKRVVLEHFSKFREWFVSPSDG